MNITKAVLIALALFMAVDLLVFAFGPRRPRVVPYYGPPQHADAPPVPPPLAKPNAPTPSE